MPRAQVYTAPVCVNGEDTSYSFVMVESLFKRRRRIIYTMLGSLFDENGLPSREVGHLKSGDRVAVYAASDETGKNRILEDEFTIDDEDIEPEKIPLPAGRYRCQYVVTDIIGRKTGSDYCIFEITDGDEGRQVQLTEIQKRTE